MSQSIEFRADAMTESGASPPEAAADFARLFVEREHVEAKIVAALFSEQLRKAGSLALRSSPDDDVPLDDASDILPNKPGHMIEMALASLQQSAMMMHEIVEDTRRDRVEFDIRRRQIDRTLARIDETLEKAIGLSQ